MEKKRRYLKLRVALMENAMSMKDLAECIGMEQQNLCNRFNGRAPWKLIEAYKVLEALRIPLDKLPEYFPEEDVANVAGV